MIDRLLGPLLGRRIDRDVAAPAGVVLRRSRWIPRLGGWLAGLSGPAAAVTIARTIVLHPRARLSEPLLRHELEHVRQWRERPFTFPFRYVWCQIRHGYRNNPYEVAARRAESATAAREE
jgi:hypothetical protein